MTKIKLIKIKQKSECRERQKDVTVITSAITGVYIYWNNFVESIES